MYTPSSSLSALLLLRGFTCPSSTAISTGEFSSHRARMRCRSNLRFRPVHAASSSSFSFSFSPVRSVLTEPYLRGHGGYLKGGYVPPFRGDDAFVSFKPNGGKNGRRLRPAVTIISWLFLLWPPPRSTDFKRIIVLHGSFARFLLNWPAPLLQEESPTV